MRRTEASRSSVAREGPWKAMLAADNIPVSAKASALCSSISRCLKIHLSAPIHEKAKAPILLRRYDQEGPRSQTILALRIHEDSHFLALPVSSINLTDTDPSLGNETWQKTREYAITLQTLMEYWRWYLHWIDHMFISLIRSRYVCRVKSIDIYFNNGGKISLVFVAFQFLEKLLLLSHWLSYNNPIYCVFNYRLALRSVLI